MTNGHFVPANELEVALLEAMNGKIPLGAFLSRFVDHDVAIPSRTEVEQTGKGMDPVLFNREGVQLVSVFIDLERAKSLAQSAQFCLLMKGRDLIARMPHGIGIVVNPGFTVGFEISPQGISEIRRDFSSRA
jgi:hypothetical protein